MFNRRVSVLGEALGALVEPGGDILDVGTGDGQIAKLIAAQAPDTSVRGIDIMARPTSHIPVDIFDGDIIPHPDKSFDVVSFVDVLHHTDDPRILLKEAARVARKAVILKDHFSQNAVDHMTLRFMDWVGNAPPWRRAALQLRLPRGLGKLVCRSRSRDRDALDRRAALPGAL